MDAVLPDCRSAVDCLRADCLVHWRTALLHGRRHRGKPAANRRHLCLGAQSHVQRLVNAVCRHLSPVARSLGSADHSGQPDTPEGTAEAYRREMTARSV